MIDFLKGTITPKDWAAVAGILAVTAAVVLGFYMLVHLPQKVLLAQVQTDDQQVYGDLEQARNISNQIALLREETESIGVLVSDFEERLPSTREISALVKEFEDMADEENVYVDLAPGDRSRDPRKETIPFEIKARGEYHDVVSFINRLERFKRYLKISGLVLEEDADEESFVTAEFVLSTYRFLGQNTESVS